jgi:hypothetical protein
VGCGAKGKEFVGRPGFGTRRCSRCCGACGCSEYGATRPASSRF